MSVMSVMGVIEHFILFYFVLYIVNKYYIY